jgi:adenylate cyclase
MNDAIFADITAWLAEAGLSAASEVDVLAGFCERAVAAGMPVGRAHVFVDTLHPVHEGAIFRWGQDNNTPSQVEYGRTREPDPSSAPGQVAHEGWRRSPFFYMLERSETFLRRRLADAGDEFGVFSELRVDGVTDYVAIINRIAPDVAVGEMDCIYSSWMARSVDGFSDDHIASLRRLTPFVALAIKSISLTRTAHTLMKTYLGSDPARRVLGGRIERGVADRIDAVLWFSDLRGFTRITDTAPEEVIPLLSDYADVIVSAVHDHGGDVLKLIGDGTLAIFTSGDRTRSCHDALAATIAARGSIARLNESRALKGRPVTDMYVGLHVGEVFYGNIGSLERLDFTVIGPAVNEVSRIAAMCRSVDQPVLISPAFAAVEGMKHRLVSVGRYALRGVGQPQELFTLDPESRA